MPVRPPRTPPITPAELRYQVTKTGSHFFERSSMKFFGDTMRNYGVRGGRHVTTATGQAVFCWELYRRHPVKHGLSSSAYFDVLTFERIHPAT